MLEKFFKNSIKLTKNINNKSDYIGYTCSYIPEEILISTGLKAIRIKGNNESNLADKYLPTNFCPYVKAVWEEIHQESNKFKAVVLANSCDGIRRLRDLVNYYENNLPSFILDIPKENSPKSIDFFTNRLKNLYGFIKQKSNNSFKNNSSLQSSVKKVNEKRKLLLELTNFYEKENKNLLNTFKYFNILNLSFSSDIDVFNYELGGYLDYIRNKESVPSKNPKPPNRPLKIMLVGNYINDNNLWEIFNNLNIKLIANDLCISYRYFNIKIDIDNLLDNNEWKNQQEVKQDKQKKQEDKILSAIAKSYILKPSCFRMLNLNEKVSQIKDQISSNQIDGVIFISLKFCDNALYFYPTLKLELNAINIPCLFLDLEYGKSSLGQLKTRVEAFIEMLSFNY